MFAELFASESIRLLKGTESMSDPVKVAVVVVNYNAGHHLEKCLSRLRDQTRLPEKIIVVDNASSDGSAKNLKGKIFRNRLGSSR